MSQSKFIIKLLITPLLIQHFCNCILSRSWNIFLLIIEWLPVILINTYRLVLCIIRNFWVIISWAWNAWWFDPWIVGFWNWKLWHLFHILNFICTGTWYHFILFQPFSPWTSNFKGFMLKRRQLNVVFLGAWNRKKLLLVFNFQARWFWNWKWWTLKF